MIEAGDVLDVMTPNQKPQTAVKATPRYQDVPRPVPGTPPAEPVKRRAKAVPQRKSGLQFAPLVVLTYLLGPLAILLTPAGRRQTSSIALAGASVMATVALVRRQFEGLVHLDHPASVWAWLALLVIAVVGGFTAWARAVHLISREGIPHVNKLPHWLRRGWMISALGLLAPGSGLLLNGRSGRAALTLWLLWPAVLAVAILTNAMGLWQHHLQSGWLAGAGPALETAFMAAGALAALGCLGYLAQALEGMRQILVEPGLKTRVKGDYYALAVIAAVVVLAVVASPVQMAHQLGAGGDILRAEGFQTIPLQLNLAARHLDAGRPEYALQAVELYTELGQTDQAAALRSDLDQSLSTYVALVQQEETPPASRPARPATAADPTLYVGTMAAGQENKPEPEPQPKPVARASVSQTMGMPFGPGLGGDTIDPSDTQMQGPRK